MASLDLNSATSILSNSLTFTPSSTIAFTPNLWLLPATSISSTPVPSSTLNVTSLTSLLSSSYTATNNGLVLNTASTSALYTTVGGSLLTVSPAPLNLNVVQTGAVYGPALPPDYYTNTEKYKISSSTVSNVTSSNVSNITSSSTSSSIANNSVSNTYTSIVFDPALASVAQTIVNINAISTIQRDATIVLPTQEAREDVRREIGKSLLELEQSSIVELYELYYDIALEPFRFHSGTNNLTRDIIWNGNSYYATAIEVEGFEANVFGRLPRPKVTVSNSDFIISSVLRDYADFRNAKFVRVKLFLKHLDDDNFDDSTNPFGHADPLSFISKEKYLISQKIIENKQLIQFELITPFDLQSLETATRAIYGRYCYWQYRGMGCNYQGDLICLENDSDFATSPQKHLRNSNGSFIDGKTYQEVINYYRWSNEKIYKEGDIVNVPNIDFNGLKDPPYTWFVCIYEHTSSRFNFPNLSPKFWQKEGCSKTLEACKKRFKIPTYNGTSIIYTAFNDSSIVNGSLPFGGFPGTDKFKYE